MTALVAVAIALSIFAVQSSSADGAVVITSHSEDKDILREKSLSHNISIVGDEFVLDGAPLHIVSGSLHYFRVPAALWRDRLYKLKAAGLNSVATYVEWSYHEPEERQYSFEGDRDIAAFVRMAAEVGLHVLLRPGPYICAERDLGGLPYWLLGKYPNIKLRSTDKDFMSETKTWFKKLFEQLSPLLFGNGGPIILVQVENEYGSYASDMAYKEQLRDIILEHTSTNALLYTTDGYYRSMFEAGHVPGALTTIDFGPNSKNAVKSAFGDLRKFMPQGPLMNSEYYPGWLTHWGEKIQQVDTDPVVKTLKDMLDLKANVNIYVFFGGTNFEFSSGANYGSTYQPDITSYDYDAPMSEAGDLTPKYHAIRNLLKQYNFIDEKYPLPSVSSKGSYGPVSVSAKAQLLSPEGREVLGKKYKGISGSQLPTFEQFRQRSGMVLYETTLREANGNLKITKPRDWIYVYVDGALQGVINRMYKALTLKLENNANSTLSLLVENQGRINFGPYLHDRKGILSTVEFNNNVLNGDWTITGYPLENVQINGASNQGKPLKLANGPILYEGSIVLPADQAPLDTFLDTTGWGRGYVWVNGRNLGRYWPGVGPQVTLYVPGVWLKPAPAPNHVQILELESAPAGLSMEFINYPILNRTSINVG